MVRLRTACSLAFILACTATFAQQESNNPPPTYYIYHGQRQNLTLDPARIAVRVPEGITRTDLLNSLAQENVQAVDPVAISGWFFVSFSKPLPGSLQTSESIARLLKLPSVEFASPVFHGIGDTWVVIGSDILLRFRAEYAKEGALLLRQMASDLTIITPDFGRMAGAFMVRSSAHNGFDVLADANRLATDPRVEWSEPDAMFSGHGDYIPNDPGFGNIWGIRNTGQLGGVAGMDMDGDLAWDFNTGSTSVKVLVIDVGVQQDHPDIHQLAGADMTGQGGGGGPVNVCDKHGTAVAGCISATIDNNLGTVGIAPGCYVISARTFISSLACDGNWSTNASWTVNALALAESVGCKVTNNSNGYGFTSSAIETKYQSTYNNGIVHFASAGNNGNSIITYPASVAYVNSVAALDPDGTLTSFSCWGTGLDFSAPGIDVYSTDRTGAAGYVTGDYVYVWGTSFASPYAAGVAALVCSAFPSYTSAQVEARMQRTCRDLGTPGYDTNFGWGFVNAYHAVTSWVTFRVNMKVKMQAGTFRPDLGDRVTVQGSFNFWTNADTLRDDDNDSVYVKTLGFTPFLGYLYKFWKTPRGALGLENDYRMVDVGDADTTLPAPYFNNDGPPLLPSFSVSLSTVNFGSVPVGHSKQDSVTVTNVGPGTLTIDSVKSSNAEFTVSPTSGTILPAGSAKFFLTFHPTSAGAKSGNVVFYHNAASSPDTVTVTGTAGSAIIPVSLVGGWNMLANPVITAADSVRTLYPQSLFPYAFRFSGATGYQQQYRMQNGTGYWVKLPLSPSPASITGTGLLSDSIDVVTGWNLVGTISDTVDTTGILSSPAGLRGSAWFGYTAGYVEATMLIPGKAYWVKAKQNGKFFFSTGGLIPVARPSLLEPGHDDRVHDSSTR